MPDTSDTPFGRIARILRKDIPLPRGWIPDAAFFRTKKWLLVTLLLVAAAAIATHPTYPASRLWWKSIEWPLALVFLAAVLTLAWISRPDRGAYVVGGLHAYCVMVTAGMSRLPNTGAPWLYQAWQLAFVGMFWFLGLTTVASIIAAVRLRRWRWLSGVPLAFITLWLGLVFIFAGARFGH
jgi:hypothetical protein